MDFNVNINNNQVQFVLELDWPVVVSELLNNNKS